MALFRAAGHPKKALGPSTVCPPNFVQVLSERCAPVTQCAVVHSRLAERMGTSLLDVSQHEIDQQGVPRAIAPLRKASQWMTLWVEHALALAYAEQSMHHKWVPNYYRNEHGEWGAAELRDEWGELEVYGAIDEFLWVPEMTQRGLKFERGGLTHVRWCSKCPHADSTDDPEGTPAAYLTWDSAIAECQDARAEGYSFARKFGNGRTLVTAEVVGALLSAACLNLQPLPASPPSASLPPVPTVAPTVAPTTAQCKPHCPGNAQPWSNKCGWSSCAGCAKCVLNPVPTVMPTPAPTVAPTSAPRHPLGHPPGHPPSPFALATTLPSDGTLASGTALRVSAPLSGSVVGFGIFLVTCLCYAACLRLGSARGRRTNGIVSRLCCSRTHARYAVPAKSEEANSSQELETGEGSLRFSSSRDRRKHGFVSKLRCSRAHVGYVDPTKSQQTGEGCRVTQEHAQEPISTSRDEGQSNPSQDEEVWRL
uniref:Uncharacterized protein n=1 Tax=Haptolina ericina TaxID=156174 RepID=A0A7S3BFR2_9EUKA